MFTKDLVGKLSPEQQEMLAQMEFRKGQRRLKLVELARGCDWRTRYFPLYTFAIFLIFITFYYFNCFQVQTRPAIVFPPLGMMLVFSVFAHIGFTNRRLDALLELMDLDREEAEKSK